jgi:predicted metal-dependent enzyme (double-stranded beta helix superfamily)
MFDPDEFITQCRAALTEHTPPLAVKELTARVMAEPAAVATALGPATKAEIGTLYRGPDLTIIKVIWAPGMAIYPHDHRMWAVIGLYGGAEANTFYRRTPAGLERAGGKDLERQDVVLLGEDVIHSVVNPRGIAAEAIHIYGGDFFAQARSEWDPATLTERPYQVENALRTFAEANERWTREQAADRKGTPQTA